jgi:hypothetical protein
MIMSTPFPFKHVQTYAGNTRPSSHANERRDCAVRALSLAAGILYATAHAMCAYAGRRSRRGFGVEKFSRVLRQAHFQEVPVLRGATLAEALPVLSNGHFVVWVHDHYFAVIHGVVVDTWQDGAESGRRKIKWVYKRCENRALGICGSLPGTRDESRPWESQIVSDLPLSLT